MSDQPQESIQHLRPDRRSPQPQQEKYLGVDRRKPHPEVGRPGGDPSAGGEPETVRQDVVREHERDKGYN
jgi:hypothetical protein